MKFITIILLLTIHTLTAQPEWTVMPSGTTNHLRAVWGTSPTNVYAVGHGGLIIHYDGSAWNKINTNINNDLVSVIGFSEDEIYILGTDTLFRFNGNSLVGVPIPGIPRFTIRNVIWGTSGSDLWLGVNPLNSGDRGIYHFNGISWEPSTVYVPVTKIHGASSTEIFAVGSIVFPSVTSILLHYKECPNQDITVWDGQGWFTQNINSAGIWTAGLNDAYMATGAEGTKGGGIYHFNGELFNGLCQWEIWNRDTIVDGNLFGIWGTSGNNIFGFGAKTRKVQGQDFRGSYIVKFDGSKWTEMTTQTDSIHDRGIYAAWATDPDNAFAVGANGLILKYKGEIINEFVVNTTSTKPDINQGDGVCDCGGPSIEGKPECSIVAAVMEANSSVTKDKIIFDIPESDAGYDPSSKTFSIIPDSSITILNPVTIDAATQPGYTDFPLIEIDGSGVSPLIEKSSGNLKLENGHCLVLTSKGNTVSGFTFIKHKGAAIYMKGGGNNKIEGNYIGVRKSGEQRLSNAIGILIEDSPENTIGGKLDEQRNTISGNTGSGIRIIGSGSKGNSIIGNEIGTKEGTFFIENGFCGIEIENSSGNIIGGDDEGEGNFIAGNSGDGIRFTLSDSNKVKKNLISVNKGLGINIDRSIGSQISGNNINANNYYELKISGNTTKNIIVTGNEFFDSDSGSIQITGGASEIKIGGFNTGESNKIRSGIFIDHPGCKKITVQNNLLEIPASWTDGEKIKVPLDLAGPGPTKNPWMGGEGTNHMKAPPRILSISVSKVTGMTRPGETVEIYRLAAWGIGRGRYFARSVEPLAHSQADSKGFFTVDVTLSEGDVITAVSTDTDGNTSELAQVKRPVIVSPGIGGSYLNGTNGDQLWLPKPLAGTDESRDALMSRLAMNPDGSSVEKVSTNGVLEFIAGTDAAYGSIMNKITEAGYQSDVSIWLDSKGNGKQPGINTDLYRFANDWRTDQYDIAKDLKDRIDWITSDNPQIARSLEVDVVCHSNGGVAAATYLRAFPEHSQLHVNRFIAIAIPYLGAHKAISAHTKGYVFEIDNELPFVLLVGNYSPNWSKMILMSKNLPASYSLIPSRKYWEASSQFNEAYLFDLSRKPLKSYDEVFSFLTSPKSLNGLGRNGTLFQSVADRVHGFIDDWTDWSGPPFIFRFAGNIPNSTPVSWGMNKWYRHPAWIPRDKLRIEPGDSKEHIVYRSAQVPILGTGDGTVPFSSATLGRAPGAGKKDFSGVTKNDLSKNHWIEDFEYFPCLHNGLLAPDCRNSSGKFILDRVTEIIKGGYTVLPAVNQSAGIFQPGYSVQDEVQDLLYVFASAPIGVHIIDNEGRHSGPESIDSVNHIEYEIPGLRYFPNDFSAALSMPAGSEYDISIYSPLGEADIQVIRMISNSETDYRNIIFPEQKVKAGGGLQLTIQSGNTPENLPLDLDSDGDNIYESKLNPGLAVNSSSSVPALPVPEPIYIREIAFTADTSDKEVEINLPGGSSTQWNWKIESSSGWIDISSDSGTTLALSKLTLHSKSLAPGNYSDSIVVKYSLDNFTLSYPVEVTLDIFEQKSLTGILIKPEFVSVLPRDSIQFIASGYDQAGDSISFTQIWNASGGIIDNTGFYIAGDSLGIFSVTVTDQSGLIKSQALVNIVTVVGVRDGLAHIPDEYFLYNNYPNPFNPSTSIKYSIPFLSRVTINVYNILGELIENIVNDIKTPGNYEFNWDASGHASGIYIYVIQAKSEDETKVYSSAKKMILLK